MQFALHEGVEEAEGEASRTEKPFGTRRFTFDLEDVLGAHGCHAVQEHHDHRPVKDRSV